MSNTYFTQVLDEPYHLGNGEFLSVITNGKARHEGEETRDFNKDTSRKNIMGSATKGTAVILFRTNWLQCEFRKYRAIGSNSFGINAHRIKRGHFSFILK